MVGRPVLVTGARGFIGRHLVRRLVEVRADVHLLVRDDASPPTDTRVWRVDLRDADAVAHVVSSVRPSVVFHLAGHTSGRGTATPAACREAMDTNLGGTINLMQAVIAHAPPGCRVVRAGGIEEYGHGPLPFDEAQRESPVSAYSASQVAATHCMEMLARHAGIPAVTLRLALIYGPGQAPTFLVPALIEACLAGRPYEIANSGHTRDYVFVTDAIEAFMRAARVDTTPEPVINVASGQEVRVDVLAGLVEHLVGTRLVRFGAPVARPGVVERQWVRTSLAERVLGWRVSTTLQDGLTATIDWYRRQA